MSYLFSLATIPVEPPRSEGGAQAEPARSGEILHPTLPSPLSGLIAEIFGQTKSFSREPVLFAAAQRGAGVTWTASAVAAELAASGRKVLLADANVVASLSKREDAIALCDRVGSDKAWVLGVEQANRSQFPVSAVRGRPSVVLSALREEFPYILLDVPALSESDLAFKLAPFTAGLVLVVRKAKTETRLVVETCGKFTMLGGQILGCVYNAH